ncbi:MAG TPA: 4-(cytidine 5'-diphospho)-2-C-methyl-D-erythritol kinase [Candidatus Krumholzibacteria bacterium]|nr:4-(cytidine 5'-diphospho)-2-C-methyl-D-erythritol kinase [Candidatus Krumholzibacteria bacterium]
MQHVTARAKVNLSLEIIRRRQDGFHEIETVFQAVDLADELRVELTADSRVTIECDAPDIPTDRQNLCHRAIVAMRPLAGPSLGARIQIRKRIPAEAGLGGGSADAAGTLRAVERALGLEIAPAVLNSVAASIGSDVPFLLHGGTMLGRGKGEILTPLEPLKRGIFVIVKPEVSISTAWVYSQFNFRLTTHRPRLNLRSANSALARFPKGRLPFRNALEDVVLPAHPVVAGLLEQLQSERPFFASMTGSGSAVFAIFDRETRAVEVAERFSVRGFFTSVARPARQAVEIR